MNGASMWLAGAVALGTAACTANPQSNAYPGVPEPEAQAATADVREPGGRTVARATLAQAGDSVRVRVEAAGLAPGAYGAHLHSTGRCDAPAFASAGPHWNPTMREHGQDNPKGAHLGDLPNLMVGTDGRGTFEYSVPGASLSRGANPLLDADGAALVIHAQADDYRTDPSGNSGARIACGVIG